MKAGIQRAMAEEEARLGREEARRRCEAWKETSTSPLALWWRTLAQTEGRYATARLREEPPKPQ